MEYKKETLEGPNIKKTLNREESVLFPEAVRKFVLLKLGNMIEQHTIFDSSCACWSPMDPEHFLSIKLFAPA